MFKHYLTTALRHFRQHKLTTSINVVCLTIGLLCFLTIYGMLSYLGSGDRHYPNAERIFTVRQASNGTPHLPMAAWQTAKYLRSDFPELEAVARATMDTGFESEVPIAVADRKSFVHVSYVDPTFLDVFSLPFLAGDPRDSLRAPRSAVLSRDTAIRFFGEISDAVGKNLRLQNGTEVTVRGVVDRLKQPSQLSNGDGDAFAMVRFDVLISMDVFESEANSNPAKQSLVTNWGIPFFATYAVLPRDGSLTEEVFRVRLSDFGQRHANNGNNKFDFGAVSLADSWLANLDLMTGANKSGIPATALFFILGGLVLLTSCINYANLAIAQAASSAKEVGMRRVLGARRGQVITQFLLEAALHTTAAVLCAVALAGAGIAVANSPSASLLLAGIVATTRFWVMLGVLALSATLVAGIYPALILSRVRPLAVVRAGSIRSGGRLVSRLLVGLQFAGASFLLISMLVMTAQNHELRQSAFKGSSDALVTLANNIRSAQIDFEVLRSELLLHPHVLDVSASSVSPWSMLASATGVSATIDTATPKIQATQSNVQHNFFSTLKIGLLAGRVFDRSRADAVTSRTDAPASPAATPVVIDRALAEANGWTQPADAIGKLLYAFDNSKPSPQATPRLVIGVVDNRAMSILNPTSAANMYVLAPEAAAFPIIRISTEDSSAALVEIERAWSKLAPAVALKAEFADAVVARNVRVIGSITTAFSGIAALALLISILGLIGLSIQVIGRRRHEIGVRKTLGASVINVTRLLLIDFSKPVVVANIIAWPAAFLAMQVYLSMFAQRTSLSSGPFVASLAITVLVAWMAVIAQATRAARLNPATVLRYE